MKCLGRYSSPHRPIFKEVNLIKIQFSYTWFNLLNEIAPLSAIVRTRHSPLLQHLGGIWEIKIVALSRRQNKFYNFFIEASI